MTFTMAEMDVVTGNSSIGTISDAQVVSLDITDTDFFAGTGAALNGSVTTSLPTVQSGFPLLPP